MADEFDIKRNLSKAHQYSELSLKIINEFLDSIEGQNLDFKLGREADELFKNVENAYYLLKKKLPQD